MTEDHHAEIVKAEPREYQGLSMPFSPAEAQRRLQELQAFVQTAMVENEDFGTIPGTDKPTLYQPGAQKLAEIYGFYPHFVPTETVKDWERGFFYFEYRCELRSRRDDSVVGEGLGSCNSRESKYAGRWVPEGDVPPGMNKAALQKRTGARWCFLSEVPKGAELHKLERQERTSKKKGTKYTVYKVVDEQFLVPNADPYSLVNTLQKMGAKRSYVHAVIAATRSAGIFTQDVEDLPPEVIGQADEVRSWGKGGAEAPAAPATETKTEEKPEVEAQASEKPVAKAPEDAPDPEAQRAHYVRLMKLIVEVANLEELKAVWAQVNATKRRSLLTEEQAAKLGELKAKRKAAIEAPAPLPDTTTDGNEAWGVGAEGPPEPTPQAPLDREPGEEG